MMELRYVDRNKQEQERGEATRQTWLGVRLKCAWTPSNAAEEDSPTGLARFFIDP